MMEPMTIKASDLIAERGIQVEVIDPSTIVPLDKETILHSVRKTGRVVIVHEAVKRGGYGGEIASIIAEEAFHSLRAPIKRLGGVAAPIPFKIGRASCREGVSISGGGGTVQWNRGEIRR